jgi:hypothetical protein
VSDSVTRSAVLLTASQCPGTTVDPKDLRRVDCSAVLGHVQCGLGVEMVAGSVIAILARAADLLSYPDAAGPLLEPARREGLAGSGGAEPVGIDQAPIGRELGGCSLVLGGDCRLHRVRRHHLTRRPAGQGLANSLRSTLSWHSSARLAGTHRAAPRGGARWSLRPTNRGTRAEGSPLMACLAGAVGGGG